MKAVETKYGIEITKPHSKAMYDHNDRVALEMKQIIIDIWARGSESISNHASNWNDVKTLGPTFNGKTRLETIQKAVLFHGYGEGYMFAEVARDVFDEIENAANWRMHEMYQELHELNMVPTIEQEMLGFTNNYNKNKQKYCSQ